MPPLVVCDASVCLKWFHEEGEEGVHEARDLLDRRDQGHLELTVLDLTSYEIGNALVRGRGLRPEAVATVLDALATVVPSTTPTQAELDLAADIAHDHGLTFYDSAYAAVARGRQGSLVTYDRALLQAGLGVRPGASVGT
jgi:predicted nucleic acid-binding protein